MSNNATMFPGAQESVWIITCAVLQESTGGFNTYVDAVCSTPERAKEELERIANRSRNSGSEAKWRARTPIGQPGDLSVELLKDGVWTCHLFYKTITKPLK